MRKATAFLVAAFFGPVGLYFAAAGAIGIMILLKALVNGSFEGWTGRLITESEDPYRFWFKFISGAAVDFAAWMLAAVVLLPLRAYLRTRFGKDL